MAIINLTSLWHREWKKGDFHCGVKMTGQALIDKIKDALDGPDDLCTLEVFPVLNKESDRSPDMQFCIMTDSRKEEQEQSKPAPKQPPQNDYYPPPPEDDIPF